MQLPTRSRVILADDTTYHFFPMTDWMPGIHAKEANMLLLLRQTTATVAEEYVVKAAIQFAETDPDDPGSWQDLVNTGSVAKVDTAGERAITTFVDVTGSGATITSGTDDNFWVRFGVGVKSDGDPQRGEVEVMVGVRA